ncbi:hypothetical protein T439DRAFT_329978 [Meredithblackwellia eburnea MCA 4105]
MDGGGERERKLRDLCDEVGDFLMWIDSKEATVSSDHLHLYPPLSQENRNLPFHDTDPALNTRRSDNHLWKHHKWSTRSVKGHLKSLLRTQELQLTPEEMEEVSVNVSVLLFRTLRREEKGKGTLKHFCSSILVYLSLHDF